ncbi:MAG: penicillin-binding transpeptidase domain-containing protein [Thermomicrobiales bacterium]
MSYSSSSSYHPSSRRPVPRGPRRWPLLLAALALAFIALIGGIWLGSGESPVGLLDRMRAGETPAGEIAQTDPPQSENNPVVIESATEAPTATSEPEEPEGDGPDPNAPAVDPNATNTPVVTAQPTSENDAVTGSSTDVAREFAQRWADGDYDGMYDLLSTNARAQTSRTDFIDRYEGIASEAGITDVAVSMRGDGGTQIPIHVTLVSSYLGAIEQDNTIATTEEDGRWLVDWSPSLIFTGLGEDCIDYTELGSSRGAILDKNGVQLAYEAVVNQVGIIPGQLTNENAEIAALSKLIGMKVEDIKDRYEDGEADWFMPITQLPDPLDNTILNGISELDGVAVRQVESRIYPYGEVAAHITGYVTAVNAEDIEANPGAGLVAGSMIGRAGVEAAANDLLSGQPGGRLAIVTCNTRTEKSVIAEKDAVEPKDVVLTIDIEFQKQVDAAVGAVTGSAVVLDPQTGAVMALVSHPSFDPNIFVTGLTDKDAATVFDETKLPLLNRATQQGYPTGSIFKVITMSAAMANLGYTGDSEIYCPTEWTIPGTDVVRRDWTYEYETGEQGMLTLHTALVNSCNTVFYELGYELDDKDENLLPDMTKAYGLGAPTGIPYLQEIAGTVPSPEWKIGNIGDYWAIGDAVNLSIGQGFLEATPLQMANVYATIANGGDLLQPFIVQSTVSEDGKTEVVGERTVIRHLPLEDWMIDELQSALRDQTSNSWGAGSVSVFGDFGWPIAGKTGTAQNEQNVAGKPHSWFAAFGPYGETAEIASIVMVESSGEGVSFAAPITRTIFSDWLADGGDTENSG